MIIDTMLYTVLIWTRSLNIMIGVMFTFGLFTSIRLNVGFVYLMELIPRHNQALITTCWCVGEGCIYLLSTVYFSSMSKDWSALGILGYLTQVLAMLGTFFLPESPALLMETGRTEEAKDSLESIAWWNNTIEKFYLHAFMKGFPKSKTIELNLTASTIEISKLPKIIGER